MHKGIIKWIIQPRRRQTRLVYVSSIPNRQLSSRMHNHPFGVWIKVLDVLSNGILVITMCTLDHVCLYSNHDRMITLQQRERVVCKSSSPDTQRCLIYTLDESNQQLRCLEYSARTKANPRGLQIEQLTAATSCSRSERIQHCPLQSKATTCAQRVQ